MDHWDKALASLNRNPQAHWDERTKGGAPHKPFLLLSILGGIEQGWISSNRIELSLRLRDSFFTYWNAMMGPERVTSIALPFYHMKSEPFWQLKYRQGQPEYSSTPSFGGLQKRVSHAEMDETLFEQMTDPMGKLQIRMLLGDHYFSPETAEQVKNLGTLNWQAHQYARKLEGLDAETVDPKELTTGEASYRVAKVQVRKAGFSIAVRDVYNNTCALCRNRLVTPGGQTLVEGAHIIPWSEAVSDDIKNGLSLCRSHHWMFDHMMITVRDDYSIEISRWPERKDNRVEDTLKLKNRQVMLPEDEKFYPSAESLAHHNDRFAEFHRKN